MECYDLRFDVDLMLPPPAVGVIYHAVYVLPLSFIAFYTCYARCCCPFWVIAVGQILRFMDGCRYTCSACGHL